MLTKLALLILALWLVSRFVRRPPVPSAAKTKAAPPMAVVTAPESERLRECLRSVDLGLAPVPLRGACPRSDVFSGRGYLEQTRYRERYLPLLLRGHVARALCTRYERTFDTEGPDTRFDIAWIDDRDRVRRATYRESYDGVHASLSSGKGSIVVDMDAHMAKGRVVTVAYDDNDHVVYDALCVEPRASDTPGERA